MINFVACDAYDASGIDHWARERGYETHCIRDPEGALYLRGQIYCRHDEFAELVRRAPSRYFLKPHRRPLVKTLVLLTSKEIGDMQRLCFLHSERGYAHEFEVGQRVQVKTGTFSGHFVEVYRLRPKGVIRLRVPLGFLDVPATFLEKINTTENIS